MNVMQKAIAMSQTIHPGSTGDSTDTPKEESHREAGEPYPTLPERERLRAIVQACHARLGRPLSAADVEEVVQDVHVNAWRSLDSFRGQSSMDTWIYGIARLCVLKRIERTNRRTDYEEPLPSEQRHPADPGTKPGSRIDTEFQGAVQHGLRDAGTTVARIIEPHDVEGRTFKEIGEELGMSETAVKSRYYRSLEALRRRLAPLWKSLKS